MDNPFEFDLLDYQYQLWGAGGGGKGGGSSRAPRETAAGNPSNSYANVIELISEGPCKGFRDINKNIFLDKTPVQNDDGSFNFTGVHLDWRSGENVQTRLAGFSDYQASETNVNVEVTQPLSATRTIINNQLDAIIVRIGVVLQQFADNGDILGDSVRFRILIQQGAGSFETRVDQTISARYPSLREFEYQLPVDNQGGNVDIFTVRVEKISTDSESSKLQRTLRWQSYIELVDAKLSYPNSFVVGLQFSAEQFSSAPERSYKIGGRLVSIPSNATVVTTPGFEGSLSFDGIWDGTLYVPTEPCSDVAWQVYDILVNDRYGLGNILSPAQISKEDLYEISLYNNASVANGFGGTEPRFRCATYIQSREEAYRYVEAMLSACNAHMYWDGLQLRFWQDRPGDIAHQFTNADVENGSFTYSSTDIKSRNSVAYVTWNDPSDFFRQAVEPVELDEAVDVYGYRETEFAAYGCFTRGQAVRAGRYQLASNFYETETVNFKTRHLGIYCRPGDIISVADSNRALLQFGGLIMAATASQITLDRAVTLSAGVTYTISIKLPSGLVQARNISNTAGTYSVINVSIPFSEVPNPESNWIIDLVDTQLFRVLTMEATGEDLSGIEIVGAQYQPSKFDFIESGWAIQPSQTQTTAPSVIDQPTNLRLDSADVPNGSGGISKSLIGTWDAPANNSQFVIGYVVEYKRELNGIWGNTRTIYGREVVFDNVPINSSYYIRVASISVNGKVSSWLESNAFFIGDNTGITINGIQQNNINRRS